MLTRRNRAGGNEVAAKTAPTSKLPGAVLTAAVLNCGTAGNLPSHATPQSWHWNAAARTA
jgi:hypothetical protein